MARLVSRAEFARLAGVSGAAITKASKGTLLPACVADRINLEHPAAGAYLASKGAKVPPPAPAPTRSKKPKVSKTPAPTPPAVAPKKVEPKPTQQRRTSGRSRETPVELTEEFEQYADLTLRQVVDRFGTIRALRDCVDALKKIEDTRGKRIDNDQTEGHLISRQLVETHVFGAIAACNTRLLRDAARTIAKRCSAMVGSGSTLEELERTIREIIGSILGPVKATAERVLRDAGKPEPE